MLLHKKCSLCYNTVKNKEVTLTVANPIAL